MSAEHKPHIGLDEIRFALAGWNDMGAVEQMREDAGGWVDYVESLLEQLEAAHRRIAELESEKPHPKWGWASD